MRNLNPVIALALPLVLLSGCNSLTPQSLPEINDPPDYRLISATEIPPAFEEESPTGKPVEYDDIWSRIRDGYGLPQADNKLIDNHLHWYANNQQHIDRFTERSEPYIHYIVSELEANDMPLELALLPIIESSYNPFAYSTRRAAGIWQFVPDTGKSFGLEQNGWYDGRRDIVASTDAAIRYLKQLHTMFNDDWLLALAAYNAGQGTLKRAIAKNQKQGKPIDFWSLPLPEQTRSYVPRLLALSRVIARPDNYNLTIASIPNDPYFTPIDLDSQINLAQIALLADIDVKEIQQLNAGYSQWLTDPSRPHQILVPVADAPNFLSHLEAMPRQPVVTWNEYKVKKGDSLSAIAKRFKTSVAAIKSNNNLKNDFLRVDQILQISGASTPPYVHNEYPSADELMRNYRKSTSSNTAFYTVKSGDNLWTIARRHNTSVAALTRTNNLSNNSKLKPGQKLLITAHAEPQLVPTETPGKMVYQIQQGDTLHAIATRFKLSTKEILEWNKVKDARFIHPGQTLTLFLKK